MDEKIKQAIELLRDNGYIAIKLTEEMSKAMEECEDGCDCMGCGANICLLQDS